MIRVLSLGAGVQSSCLLLMSLKGEVAPYDLIVFADTGWEPRAVYEHLERLKVEADQHGKTIETVRLGNIREDHVSPTAQRLFIRTPIKHPEMKGKQKASIPFFLQHEATADNNGGKGRTWRTCTANYKIGPVEQRVRKELGLKPKSPWPQEPLALMSFGISWDEMTRMRESKRAAIVNDYPLIDMRMTRDDCVEWMAQRGWEAPRSACIGCPFHRNDEWRRMRDTDPEAWEDAIDFDETFRRRQAEGLTVLNAIPYLHDSRVPLRDADIDTGGSDVQSAFGDTMFGESCEGFCGT